jgi:ketosteroid isomerase-like protein
MRLSLFAIVVVAVAAACQQSTEEDASISRETIARLTAETEAAENAGSVEPMRVHFADDIVMMAPNMPAVAGADSVAAAMQAFFDAVTLEIEYASAEIVVSGDWAFDRGTVRQTLIPKDGGPSITEAGKYLWVYHRSPDGVWKQSRVIWNSSEALPPGGA